MKKIKFIDRPELMQKKEKLPPIRVSKNDKLKMLIICTRREIELKEFVKEAIQNHITKQKNFLV